MPAIDWSTVGINVGAAVGVILAGLVAHALVFIALKRIAARGHRSLDESITLHCAAPLRLIFPLLALDIVMPSLTIQPAVDDLVQHVIALSLILALPQLRSLIGSNDFTNKLAQLAGKVAPYKMVLGCAVVLSVSFYFTRMIASP